MTKDIVRRYAVLLVLAFGLEGRRGMKATHQQSVRLSRGEVAAVCASISVSIEKLLIPKQRCCCLCVGSYVL